MSMTPEEATKILEAKSKCMKREFSGTDFDCNFHNCYKCDLNYEQGTIGDQIEALSVIISALQAQDVPDINVGDVVSRQKAIDALCRRCDLAAEDDEPCTEKCNDIKILEKLPSTQPENTDCIYCHEDSDGYVKPIEKNCHAFIHFGMNGWEISLSAKGWNGSAKIMYCPMCGRKLKK